MAKSWSRTLFVLLFLIYFSLEIKVIYRFLTFDILRGDRMDNPEYYEDYLASLEKQRASRDFAERCRKAYEKGC